MGSWLRRLWAAADPRCLLLGFALRSMGTAPSVIRDVDVGRRNGLSRHLVGREPHVGAIMLPPALDRDRCRFVDRCL
jgi:hypothetical protein